MHILPETYPSVGYVIIHSQSELPNILYVMSHPANISDSIKKYNCVLAQSSLANLTLHRNKNSYPELCHPDLISAVKLQHINHMSLPGTINVSRVES